MYNLLKMLWQEDDAQDLAEFALLLMLISLVTVFALHSVGVTNNRMFLQAVYAFFKPRLVGA